MALHSLYKSATLSKDAGGHRAASITYRGSPALTSAAQALAEFDADQAYRQHPDDPTIPFDRRTAIPSPNRVEYWVQADFSTFRGGRMQTTPPLDDPGWYSFTRGRKRTEAELAFNVREWRIPEADETAAYQVWVLHKVKTPEVRSLRTLNVRIVTSTQSIFDPIDSAIDEIHLLPDGRYWQLVDAETAAVDAVTWDVSYTWELDQGTPYPNPPAGEGWEIASYDYTTFPIQYDVQSLWRPPYGKVSVPIVPEDPRVEQFMVEFTLTGRLNQNGYQALPGTGVL